MGGWKTEREREREGNFCQLFYALSSVKAAGRGGGGGGGEGWVKQLRSF